MRPLLFIKEGKRRLPFKPTLPNVLLAYNRIGIVGIFFFLLGGYLLYRAYQTFRNYLDKSAHTCVVSRVNGHTYCVRDRKRVTEAADKLARAAKQCSLLIEYMDKRGLSPELTARLKNKFEPDRFVETLPTSQYEAYSENKGDEVALCLNDKKGVKHTDAHIIDDHTLMFVAIHELGHICTVSIGHEPEFWANFKTLLQHAKAAGIHEPVDYEKTPKSYCGLKIGDNPYFT